MQPKTKTVWQVDEYGLIREVVTLSESGGDFKEGQWLIPAGCVEVEPLPEKEGYCDRWNGETWEYAEIQLTDEVEPGEEINPPTTAELLNRLNGEFESLKSEITGAFLTAQIKEDLELQEELKAELEELEADYKVKKEKINKGLNLWEDGENAE